MEFPFDADSIDVKLLVTGQLVAQFNAQNDQIYNGAEEAVSFKELFSAIIVVDNPRMLHLGYQSSDLPCVSVGRFSMAQCNQCYFFHSLLFGLNLLWFAIVPSNQSRVRKWRGGLDLYI